MATLSASTIHHLINRFLYARRVAPPAIFDIVRAEYPAVRVLAESGRCSPDEVDEAWLQRVELRGAQQVIDILERDGFCRQPGMRAAMFVDDRCGLIGSELLDIVGDIDRSQLIADILRRASRCQASGIVLATHDASKTLATAAERRRFTMDLYLKGEAIGVFLLDHFVLTAAGWSRMFSFREKGRI